MPAFMNRMMREDAGRRATRSESGAVGTRAADGAPVVARMMPAVVNVPATAVFNLHMTGRCGVCVA